MGLMLAEPGFHTRAFVEWEDWPRAVLIAAQRAGYFAPAPIWDDLTTFDGRPFRGAIDTILAGYPCQPFSHAGQRRGEDDERHLWPDVARVIREIEPQWVFLENVAGHVSLGAETVLRELWDMGWTPAAGTFSASETGAPHERLRWFCVAYRRDARSSRAGGEPQSGGSVELTCDGGGIQMAHSDGRDTGAERQQRSGKLGFQPEGGRAGADDVVHAEHPERRSDATGRNITDGDDAGRNQAAGRAGKSDADVDHSASARRDDARLGAGSDFESGECLSGAGCGAMGHTPRIGRGEGRAEHGVRFGRDTATGSGGAMADASGSERQGEQPGQRDAGGRQEPHGHSALPGRTGLFPPGPGDAAAWAAVLRSAPDMAPAAAARDLHAWARRLEADGREWWQAEAEPGFCRMVTGLSARSQPLRLLGNAVVPICAAHAWRSLARAHGLHPIIIGDEE